MTGSVPGVDRSLVHRALSSPSRSRLLALLRGTDDPESIASLAEMAALHPNTVRAHLSVLEEAGLVRSRTQSRQGPGRPRLVYEADQEADPGETDGHDPAGGYRFLAQMLAGHVAVTAENPALEATTLGAAWGRHLASTPPPSGSVERATALTELVSMLAELGFDPVVEDVGQADDAEDARDGPDAGDPQRLLLRRCPFLAVAEEHQDVVCSIHLGLMRGAMGEFGDRVEVVDLVPFAGPDGCVSHLA